MELIATLKELHKKLPGYGFEPEVEEALSAYLAFLREREDLLNLAQSYNDDIYDNHRYTLAQVEGLQEQDGREEGLLFAVLYLARYEKLDEVLAKRGIPAKYKAGALQTLKGLLRKNKNCYGSIGLRGMYRSGMTHYLVPDKIILGRLCFEMTHFDGSYEVYRNKKTGETLPVALPGFRYMENGKRPPKNYEGTLLEPWLKQEGDTLECFTFLENGRLQMKPIKLHLPDYEKALKSGDGIISVHIPAEGRMTPELVDEAFAMAEAFFPQYYPELDIKAYMCGSWLLNTDMQEFLNPESNIILFQKRFRVILTGTNGYSLYWHIFGVENFVPLEELKPANQFQQTFLDRVKAGKHLYSGYGYILK